MLDIKTIKKTKEYLNIKKDIVEIFSRTNKKKLLELYKYIETKNRL